VAKGTTIRSWLIQRVCKETSMLCRLLKTAEGLMKNLIDGCACVDFTAAKGH
jgi:hypothetical protein